MWLETFRYLLSNDIDRLKLYVFVDASGVAYGATIYFGDKNKLSLITFRLCYANSRVSPLETLSAPCLELLCTVRYLVNLVIVLPNWTIFIILSKLRVVKTTKAYVRLFQIFLQKYFRQLFVLSPDVAPVAP